VHLRKIFDEVGHEDLMASGDDLADANALARLIWSREMVVRSRSGTLADVEGLRG
jgi:hypothetical protein